MPCLRGIGDVFDFYQKVNNVDFPSALRELAATAGLSGAPKPQRQRVVATFKYRDAAGKLLYWKERVEPGPNGRKRRVSFFPR